MHGDLGMVTSKDIVLAISNSGETGELTIILPSLRRIGAKLIAFTGNPESTLARQSDMVIDVGVEKEACPWGMVPTASTTAALAMGDALAVALIKRRQFNHQDFRRFHPGRQPGGTAGRQGRGGHAHRRPGPPGFSGPTSGGSHPGDGWQGPGGHPGGGRRRADPGGILTDGDLRRLIKRRIPLQETLTGQVMTPNPKSISPEVLASEALELMEAYLITVLPIVDPEQRVLGILHLHDLLGRGEFKFR